SRAARCERLVRNSVSRFGLLAVVRKGKHRVGDDAGLLTHAALDGVGQLAMFAQERLRVLAPLADTLAVVAEPSAGFLDHGCLHAKIDQLADLAHAFAVHDVELHLPERRGELVFTTFTRVWLPS